MRRHGDETRGCLYPEPQPPPPEALNLMSNQKRMRKVHDISTLYILFLCRPNTDASVNWTSINKRIRAYSNSFLHPPELLHLIDGRLGHKIMINARKSTTLYTRLSFCMCKHVRHWLRNYHSGQLALRCIMACSCNCSIAGTNQRARWILPVHHFARQLPVIKLLF